MYLSQLFSTWQLIFHGLHDQSNFVLQSSVVSLLSVHSRKEKYVLTFKYLICVLIFFPVIILFVHCYFCILCLTIISSTSMSLELVCKYVDAVE